MGRSVGPNSGEGGLIPGKKLGRVQKGKVGGMGLGRVYYLEWPWVPKG